MILDAKPRNFITASYPKPSSLFDFVRNGKTTDTLNYNAVVSDKEHTSSNSIMRPNFSVASSSASVMGFVRFAFALITAPRLRRYIIVYAVLLIICWASWVRFASPLLKEHGDLNKALSSKTRDRIGGWYGTAAVPRFSDMVHIRSLDPSLLPGSEELSAGDPNRRRLVVVGDVHGCRDELEELLTKLQFDRENGDHLIFTGDMVSQGPRSVDTILLARQQHASCVRGNNEDRILLTRREIATWKKTPLGGPKILSMENEDPDTNDDHFENVEQGERSIARQLNDDDANWLSACPVILKLGQINNMGEVVVVHGGLVPGVPLENQDPSSVMTMRTIDRDSHVPSSTQKGIEWAKLFNKHQTAVAGGRKVPSMIKDGPESPNPTTVIYGHDQEEPLLMRKYAKGLGTSCVRGGALSALVITDGGEHHIEQVQCPNYRKEQEKP